MKKLSIIMFALLLSTSVFAKADCSAYKGTLSRKASAELNKVESKEDIIKKEQTVKTISV